MYNTFEFRETERTSYCRVCDSKIPRGDLVFYTYSRRNRGIYVIICLDCIEDISKEYHVL